MPPLLFQHLERTIPLCSGLLHLMQRFSTLFISWHTKTNDYDAVAHRKQCITFFVDLTKNRYTFDLLTVNSYCFVDYCHFFLWPLKGKEAEVLTKQLGIACFEKFLRHTSWKWLQWEDCAHCYCSSLDNMSFIFGCSQVLLCASLWFDYDVSRM